MSFDLFGALSPTESRDGEPDWSEDTKKTDGEEKNSRSCRQVSQVEVEGSMVPYEGTFEDYLEMFIQFGYVTLFSSAYPLAGLCALLNNLIEVRSDAFKLCFIHQRPFTERVQVRPRLGSVEEEDLQPFITEYRLLADSDGSDGRDRSSRKLCFNR